MRNDFMMAINQVCHERQLSVEVVLEAVEVALVSAYKRNYGGNSVTAKIDQDTGEISIFVEKEVVEDIFDDKNEISLDVARQIDPEAALEDVVQVESTPSDFGRIATQTTKQVILQRIREAEREALYKTYVEREGEIINGTVQKATPNQVIIALGNVEAVLPRSEQIPGERYMPNQRLRAYVAEVNKTPRGPQIVLSRTHRNMLRRLLEVEVPEIYNGTVEIKAIAREAGHRSKVAVAALQEGVDPVGSCVGMRGVRIQSIVNELGGEKIDVTEWNPDTGVFIANALSPAKVLNVILHDIIGDKTAMVVVPDRQLSLAIGKEGQNARLAAKLTGWRIDIKSVVEAVKEAIERASASEEIKALVSNRPEVFSLVSAILEERADGSEMSPGELNLLSEAIGLVSKAELQIAREKMETERAARAKARADEMGVDLLAEAAALLSEAAPIEAEVAEVAEDESEVAEAAEAEEEAVEVAAKEETVVAAEPVIEPEAELEAVEEPEPTDETSVTDGSIPSVLESLVAEPAKPKKKPKKRLKLVIAEEDTTEADSASKKRGKSKSRRLEYDENLGKVVVKRQRKKSRARDDWEDYLD
ncbi:MAG TPA: transcription termination/antitermination protein NusA [Chloroflexi bacterium]|nr:transcription termination/antitermination protein NusA [Chloroflexota bacterium]